MSGLRRSLVLGSPRELGTVGLVSGLCGAYAAVLIMTSVFLVTVADEAGGGVAAVLGVVATVFIGIAVYVGAIVMVNAVDTVLAGRLSQIQADAAAPRKVHEINLVGFSETERRLSPD